MDALFLCQVIGYSTAGWQVGVVVIIFTVETAAAVVDAIVVEMAATGAVRCRP